MTPLALLASALDRPSPRPATGFVIGYVTELIPALGQRLAPTAIISSIHGGLRMILPTIGGKHANVEVENSGEITVVFDAGGGPSRVSAKVGSVVQRLLEFYGKEPA